MAEPTLCPVPPECPHVEAVRAELKWTPIKLLGSSAVVLFVALASYAVFFVARTDDARAELRQAQVASELRSSERTNALRDALQNHIAEEMQSRERLEKKLDKVLDVVVFQRPPALVRGER